jgi:hypothetical protein
MPEITKNDPRIKPTINKSGINETAIVSIPAIKK